MLVLHVLDHSIPLQSGYTFRSREIIQQQRSFGWQTLQLTSPKHNPGKSVPATEQVEGLDFFRCDSPASMFARLPVLGQLSVIESLSRRLYEVAESRRPDIIHAHSPALNGVAAVRVGRKLGIPVVYEVRGFWEDAAVSHGTSAEWGVRYRLTRAMETWVMQRADAVTCICDGLREDLLDRGIAAAKITVIPNAVNADRFQPISNRDARLEAALGLEGKRVIGFIGSFYAYEGLDLLVAAMPELLRALPDLKLLLVGGGQVEAQLRRQVDDLGIADRVHMVGRVPQSEVDDYYSLVDILVYPRKSLRITELVTPLKPLEAMAKKSIFLASDVGGHRELVRDGVTGTLFRADDVDDLVRKVRQLFAQEQSWPVIREAGRAFVESERTWNNSISRLAPLYERLATGAS